MFDHQRNYAVALTLVFMFYSTRADSEMPAICERSCGGYTVQYPFGFSGECQIILNCSNNHHIEIGGFEVQKVTSSSIFINLPAKCNRSMQSINPLFSENFAPTRNNSLLVQTCSSAVGGCVIPTTSLMGNQFKLADCDESSDNISCFTELQTKNASDVLTYDDVSRTKCQFLFSAIANEQAEDLAVSLQFQVLELGWWHESPCSCYENANCIEVHLADGKLGFRCQCAENYIGDGYNNGNGCRTSCAVRHCHAATHISSLIIGIWAVAFFIVIVCLLYNINLQHLRKKERERVERLLREAAGNSNLAVYSYIEIEEATNRFSEQRKLGSGAFGTVYLGKLHNEWVAIKKIKHRDNNSIVKVINEINLLSSVSHPNLVRILGCWIGEGEQILVLEFIPNGTLSQHLQRLRGTVLPWITRLTIATETANAIAYLHSAIDPPIYHRDIKSSNILLDYNFRSKVADFGLSRLGTTDISHISTAPQGTPGYVDPSYEQNFHLSDKSDVYSFGVVLVEIITALKPVDLSRPPSKVYLAALAIGRIGRGCVNEIVDPFLLQHADAGMNYSVQKVAELAFRCLDFRRDVRPTMMEVAEELKYIKSNGCEKMKKTICTTSSGASHINENESVNLGTETLTDHVDG